MLAFNTIQASGKDEILVFLGNFIKTSSCKYNMSSKNYSNKNYLYWY